MAKKTPSLADLIPQQHPHIFDVDDVLAPQRDGDVVVGVNTPPERPFSPREMFSLDGILTRPDDSSGK